MSLLLLVDGYNVVSPAAPPTRPDRNWLQRERMQLINRLAGKLEADVRKRTCVVFDAANPPRDRPSEFVIEGIEVRFAVGYAEADDLIEELIAAHHSPKQLMVVSSDHRLHAAAKRRGAKSCDSEPWLDALLDGRTRLAIDMAKNDAATVEEKPIEGLADRDVSDWMKEFGFDE